MMPPELTGTEHPLVERLRAAIGCPIDWDRIPSVSVHPTLAKDLRIYWVKIAEDFETDMELRFYSRLNVKTCLNEEELKRIETNTSGWRHRAVVEYNSRVGFLKSLHFATWEQYAKHRPPPCSSRDTILELTARKSAPSLFFSDEILPVCEESLWEAIGDDLLNVVENRPAHLFVESKCELGACGGKPCNVMRLDIDYSKPLAHGHPRPAQANYALLGGSCFKEAFTDHDYLTFSNDIDEPPLIDYYAYLDRMNGKKGKRH